MDIDITSRPGYAAAVCTLSPGESVKAEGGAMMAMSSNVEIQTSTGGGMLKGLRRAVLGGESFFVNTFTAQGGPGTITFAPVLPGDIVTWTLSGETVFLQSGAYLAAGSEIEVDSKWGGAKTFFGGEGLFMLRCTGTGPLLVASYGAIETMDLAPGERHVVDTGHLVGWSEGVDFKVRKVGGWKSTLLSGEGFVVDLTGPGRVYLQTRSQDAFLGWLIPKLPRDTSSN
ncbi:TIGR00266 family protein [Mumia sp. zg.B17]|uniref:TIGR00266 family protein n=1 Tax=Mumia sp. zg.B17 TaxID=2855446 RepID=UPI001C6EA7AE|nr:TIGR00266 family protein [Mumia sp. zg.B17]MBW9205331.1 TIGR00266 family protein [Mumia sp. zg.B17]